MKKNGELPEQAQNLLADTTEKEYKALTESKKVAPNKLNETTKHITQYEALKKNLVGLYIKENGDMIE